LADLISGKEGAPTPPAARNKYSAGQPSVSDAREAVFVQSDDRSRRQSRRHTLDGGKRPTKGRYSLGLEEDAGWAEHFLAAFDRVIGER
jgi:hypothetical protein